MHTSHCRSSYHVIMIALAFMCTGLLSWSLQSGTWSFQGVTWAAHHLDKQSPKNVVSAKNQTRRGSSSGWGVDKAT